MSSPSRPPFFGDLLALARQAWIAHMAAGVEELGYPEYRRSDALVLRVLQHGPLSVGGLGDLLGISRQAARKVVDALQKRGYATVAHDERDARRLNVALTPTGEQYLLAVVATIDRLNEQLARQVDPADLAAATRVLRAVTTDDPITPRERDRSHDVLGRGGQ